MKHLGFLKHHITAKITATQNTTDFINYKIVMIQEKRNCSCGTNHNYSFQVLLSKQ